MKLRAPGTLFWRVFGAFVLVYVVTGVLFAVLVRPLWSQLDTDRPDPARFVQAAQTAAAAYARGERRVAARQLRADAERLRVVATLLTADGAPAFRRVPRPLADALERFDQALGAPVSAPDVIALPRRAAAPRAWLIRVPVQVGSRGETLQWVGLHVDRGRRGTARVLFWLRIGLTILVLALVCAWLSRWLSRPIAQLTAATRALEHGDLSARVSDAVSGRRDDFGGLGRAFNDMAAQISTLVTARDQLVRDVSHELRSPLARLRVALELARDGNASALDRAERETERLDQLIGEVLALSRLGSQRGVEAPEPVDLNALCRGVAADAAFESGRPLEDAVALSLPTVPVTVLGDAGLLRSAVENVLRNALRYGPDDQAVDLSLTGADSTAQIVIRDRGPGVPRQELQTIFQPFYRAQRARDRASGGHGVGLAIVARVAQAHGGEAWAELPADGAGGLAVTLTLTTADTQKRKA